MEVYFAFAQLLFTKQKQTTKFDLKAKSNSKSNFHRSNLDFAQVEGVQDMFAKIEDKVNDLEAWNLLPIMTKSPITATVSQNPSISFHCQNVKVRFVEGFKTS